MSKHKHAELMMLYAHDSMQTDEPWKLWEFNSGGNWNNLDSNPSWFNTDEYRRKPKTIRIGNYDVPEPLRESPKNGTEIFIIDLCAYENYTSAIWMDNYWKTELEFGIIHLSKDAVKLHAKALISLTAKTSVS